MFIHSSTKIYPLDSKNSQKQLSKDFTRLIPQPHNIENFEKSDVDTSKIKPNDESKLFRNQNNPIIGSVIAPIHDVHNTNTLVNLKSINEANLNEPSNTRGEFSRRTAKRREEYNKTKIILYEMEKELNFLNQ